MEQQNQNEPEIVREAVESSQIKSVGYNATLRVLEVEFKGGSIYQYYNVDAPIHADFMKAESKGKYFGAVIKNNPTAFPYVKMRGTDREEAKNNPSDVKNV